MTCFPEFHKNDGNYCGANENEGFEGSLVARKKANQLRFALNFNDGFFKTGQTRWQWKVSIHKVYFPAHLFLQYKV